MRRGRRTAAASGPARRGRLLPRNRPRRWSRRPLRLWRGWRSGGWRRGRRGTPFHSHRLGWPWRDRLLPRNRHPLRPLIFAWRRRVRRLRPHPRHRLAGRRRWRRRLRSSRDRRHRRRRGRTV